MRWFKQLFSRQPRYDELSASIREHLAEKIDALMEGGMSREDAESSALLQTCASTVCCVFSEYTGTAT
jgi:putative ABC transport system permease protein